MTTQKAPAMQFHRLGVVSFLNARPLIEGLNYDDGISLVYDVPSRLAGLLEAGEVDAALVPVIDIVRPGRHWKIISDACIGCDGETLTVRIFSRIPPDEITRLHVDGDSHTSVALASVVWREMFGTQLTILPFESSAGELSRVEAVLLIGDKVVNPRLPEFDIETDLGGAWKSLTGLPFVFAAWVADQGYDVGTLPTLLERARDAGVANAAHIAQNAGPALGWPVELATRYLTHRLRFRITERHREAMQLFLHLVQQQLIPEAQELVFA